MKAFRFDRPMTTGAAARILKEDPKAVLKAGGVDLLDRMKERITEPDRVVGLADLARGGRARGELVIEANEDRLVLHALSTLAEIAASEAVRANAPALAESAADAASPQIRNLATLGGNLAQRTRCGYYRLRSFPCLRRGDTVCSTRRDGGVQETAAIYANDPCASAHPSSLAPVLAALSASVSSTDRTRGLATIYEQQPDDDAWLETGEILESVEIPIPAVRQGYVEIRQRRSFDWPLVSAAVRLDVQAGRIADASIWLGAVAPNPWRAGSAEDVLRGKAFTEELVAKAGEAATKGATPLPGNRYKVELVKVAVRRAVAKAWARGEGS